MVVDRSRVVRTLTAVLRLSSRGILTVATAVLALYVVMTPATTSTSQALTVWQGLAHDSYPRLANYNGLIHSWDVPFIAGDNLVVARRDAPIKQLAQGNPKALTLLYERTLQVDTCCTKSLYGLTTSQIPAVWWLTEPGSRLLRPVSAHNDWLSVANPRAFSRCEDVLVGDESMHVRSIQGGLLHVQRGYYSTPAAHTAQTRVAIHYSYRRDLSNCVPFAHRPWSFNMSSLCPTYQGQTWSDFLAHYIVGLVRRQGWDGLFYDNLTDVPQSPKVDVNNDGQADGGVVDGVNVWREGQRALLAATRRIDPTLPLFINGDLQVNGLAQGREMEAFPLIPGAALSAAIDSYLADKSFGITATIINPDSVTRTHPSVQAAELAVGASLLGDGYAAYDFGWLRHGYPWWFDVYDNGAGSILTAPLDAYGNVLHLVHPERFRIGDVVLFDEEAGLVSRVMREGLVVQRGILHTNVAHHLKGTKVTTAAQREAGAGYLGRPLNDTYLVRTGSWEKFDLPTYLSQGPALVDGLPQLVPTIALTPKMSLSVVSTAHYDADAVAVRVRAPRQRLARRTVVFSARGPAGQWMTLSSPGSKVSLVLWPAWHRYQIPITGSGTVTLGLGRVRGEVQIRAFAIMSVQAYVLRRDFSGGTALVNPTDVNQTVALHGTYRLLSSDEEHHSQFGKLVDHITLNRLSAAILLRP